ncbi:MAG: PrsW family intramembrane metalloprotease [Clostridia bacterium]|nr:PrsW family intramembrane metalloprotease [Clostridia bacterium]
MYCSVCGTQCPDGAQFCPKCGAPLAADRAASGAGQYQAAPGQAYQAAPGAPAGQQNQAVPGAANGSFMEKINHKIEDLVGDKSTEKFKLGDLFSDVFKKHSSEETDRIFIRGTSVTTPSLGSLNAEWKKPWLYSRIFLLLLGAFVILYVCTASLNNINTLPGVIFLGSFMVPISLLVLFFEMNVPQNISFIKMVRLFLIGGCASLLLSLLIFEIFPVNQLDFGGAIAVGVIEEAGKMLIVAALIYREKESDYLLNGLLIGAAVGAGFAAFESAGYALVNWAASGYDTMISVIFLRGFLAPGGHIVWAAIEGFALMSAKGDQKLSGQTFSSPKFWKLVWIPVVLHAIWDMPIMFLNEIYFIQILLTVVSWAVMLVLISIGLSQINRKIALLHSQPQSDPAFAEPQSDPAFSQPQWAPPAQPESPQAFAPPCQQAENAQSQNIRQ